MTITDDRLRKLASLRGDKYQEEAEMARELLALRQSSQTAGDRETPPIIHLRKDDGKPEWEQVNDTFKRHGLPSPDWRLRDELVSWLAWARFGKRSTGAE